MRQRTIELISRNCILLVILGLFFSNALKSIGIVGLAVTVVLHPDSIKNFRTLFQNRLFMSALIIAAFFLFSFLYGGNLPYYWTGAHKKILYFFVPVALYNGSFKQHEIRRVKYLFLACCMVQSVYAAAFWLLNPEISSIYSFGRVLPTIEINHVEISWLISIGFLLVVDEMGRVSSLFHKFIGGIMGFWFFFFLHLFAVRTGIAALYIFLMIYFIVYFIKFRPVRKWLVGLGIITVLLIFFSYRQLDSVSNKINYMMYDIGLFKSGNANLQQYSDGRRLLSVKIGMRLIKENPWFGCGIGNIQDRCNQIYKKKYPEVNEQNYYRPHSYYIYILTCFGFIPGSLLLLCFVFPLYYFLKEKKILLFAFYSSVLVISLWDVIIGTLFGECLYLLCIGWGLKNCSDESITSY